MKTLRVAAAAVLTLALAAGGCAGQADPRLVVSSDPELGAMAAGLLSDLARRSGMELTGPVRLEKRSRAELVRYLRAKLDEELPAQEARDRVDAYALLGMVSPELDLRAVLLDLYTEQVAGFYEPDSTALFVMDDQPDDAIEALLIHELVHAVQDQSVDLDELTDADRWGGDRATAAQAAIEGHATLVMFEFLTERMTGGPVDLGELPDFGGQLRPVLEASTQFPALASAPPVLREALLFPYIDGAGYVQGLWAAGGPRDPFGSRLPESTEQVVDREAAPPLTISLGVEGARVIRQDVLGRLELEILLAGLPGVDAVAASEIADGWDGDLWALVQSTDGGRALVSAVVWESGALRDRFLDSVRAGADALGGPARLEAVEVEGRPASLLYVGAPGWSVAASLVSDGGA